jgi:hypothetical protein
LSAEKIKTSAFGIKKELYRPIQSILACLCIFLAIDQNSSFEMVDAIRNSEVFSQKGAGNIALALGMDCNSVRVSLCILEDFSYFQAKFYRCVSSLTFFIALRKNSYCIWMENRRKAAFSIWKVDDWSYWKKFTERSYRYTIVVKLS